MYQICQILAQIKIRVFVPDDNLGSADPSVQEKAVLAVPSFVGEYFKDATEEKRNQVSSFS